jgi:hypothetical protein
VRIHAICSEKRYGWSEQVARKDLTGEVWCSQCA